MSNQQQQQEKEKEQAPVHGPSFQTMKLTDRHAIHCACIQFSVAMPIENVASEHRSAQSYVLANAEKHCEYILLALQWRLIDATDPQDRLGCFLLIDSLLRLGNTGDHTEPISDGVFRFVRSLELLLPELVTAHWCKGAMSGRDAVGAETKKREQVSVVMKHARGSNELVAYHKHYVEEAAMDADAEARLKARYRDLFRSWNSFFVKNVFKKLDAAVKTVAVSGNVSNGRQLKMEKDLRDDRHKLGFRDSLHKLRRQSPRPRLAHEVAKHFGIIVTGISVDNAHQNKTMQAAKKANRSIDQIPASMVIHPHAREWIKRLINERPCADCDTWAHSAERCPNHPRRVALVTLMPCREAVAKLRRYGIADPERPSEGQVLDSVCELMQKNAPFEDLLCAFDSVRGFVTSSESRRAMFILSSYHLKPSQLVFKKTIRKQGTPAQERVKEALVNKNRAAEYLTLKLAIITLYDDFCGGRLTKNQNDALITVKNRQSLLFCFTNARFANANFDVQLVSECPEAVQKLASVVRRLCEKCLSLDHRTSDCDKEELWDHKIARANISLFPDADLLSARPDAVEAEVVRLEREMRGDSKHDTRNEQMIARLRASVAITLKAKVPYCRGCEIFGHNGKSCFKRVAETLKNLRMTLQQVRLDPSLLEDELRELSRRDRDDPFLGAVRTAHTVISRDKAFPANFNQAINKLGPRYLQAAQYAPLHLTQYLHARHETELVPYIRVVQDPGFPEVCVLCDERASTHSTKDCHRRADEALSKLSDELGRFGTSLPEFATERTDAAKFAATLISQDDMGRAVFQQRVELLKTRLDVEGAREHTSRLEVQRDLRAGGGARSSYSKTSRIEKMSQILTESAVDFSGAPPAAFSDDHLLQSEEFLNGVTSSDLSVPPPGFSLARKRSREGDDEMNSSSQRRSGGRDYDDRRFKPVYEAAAVAPPGYSWTSGGGGGDSQQQLPPPPAHDGWDTAPVQPAPPPPPPQYVAEGFTAVPVPAPAAVVPPVAAAPPGFSVVPQPGLLQPPVHHQQHPPAAPAAPQQPPVTEHF